MPRAFGEPVKYLLRVTYKVSLNGIEVGSRLEAESPERAEIDLAMARICEIVQQASGYDMRADLITVDQHGNTRQEEFVAAES